MQFVKAITKQILWKLGCQVIPNQPIEEVAFSVRLKNLLSHHAINCVLDIGANRGQYARFLRNECGYEGLIVSYEPIGEVFAELEKAAAEDPMWLVRNVALGSENGQAPLNVMQSDVFSSFLEPSADMVEHWVDANKTVNKEVVQVCRLDTEDLPSGAIIHLKIDTQGYDLEVLKGADVLMDAVQSAQAELAFRTVYEDAPQWVETISAFTAKGLKFAGSYGISYDKMALISADGLFTK